MAISEGTSGGLDHARVVAKYGGLAEVIGRALKARVRVVFAREFATLDQGLRKDSFDFVFARPSDYPARGIRDHGYRYVATALPDGQCLIITGKDSAVTNLEQAKGKRWVFPERVSYMARFCAAELRDKGVALANEKVQHVREQGAVTFYIEHRLADVGGIASYSSVARTLAKDGHRVLHSSVKQPYFPLIASGRIPPEQLRAIQAELVALPRSEAGKEVLRTIGVAAFDISSSGRLQSLLPWLGQ